jgi:hypothetical protein
MRLTYGLLKNKGLTTESSCNVACEYYDNPSNIRLASVLYVRYTLRKKKKMKMNMTAMVTRNDSQW